MVQDLVELEVLTTRPYMHFMYVIFYMQYFIDHPFHQIIQDHICICCLVILIMRHIDHLHLQVINVSILIPLANRCMRHFQHPGRSYDITQFSFTIWSPTHGMHSIIFTLKFHSYVVCMCKSDSKMLIIYILIYVYLQVDNNFTMDIFTDTTFTHEMHGSHVQPIVVKPSNS